MGLHPSRTPAECFWWSNSQFWSADEVIGIFLFSSDWLLTTFWFGATTESVRQSFKTSIGVGQCLSIGYRVLPCAKMQSRVQWFIFATVKLFEEEIFEIFLQGPRRYSLEWVLNTTTEIDSFFSRRRLWLTPANTQFLFSTGLPKIDMRFW